MFFSKLQQTINSLQYPCHIKNCHTALQKPSSFYPLLLGQCAVNTSATLGQIFHPVPCLFHSCFQTGGQGCAVQYRTMSQGDNYQYKFSLFLRLHKKSSTTPPGISYYTEITEITMSMPLRWQNRQAKKG